MVLLTLLLVTAVTLAATAGFFSVYGLQLLFVGAGIAIVIMGAALEVGKIVAATYLHNHWANISKALKWYLTSAVLVLMFITSLGVYGFLSAGYNETNLTVQRLETNIETIEDQIESNKQKINVLTTEERRLKGVDIVQQTISTKKQQTAQQIEQLKQQIDNLNTTTKQNISSLQQQIEAEKDNVYRLIESGTEQISSLNDRLRELDESVNSWRERAQDKLFKQKFLTRANEILESQQEERQQINTRKKQINDQIVYLQQQLDEYTKQNSDQIGQLYTRQQEQEQKIISQIDEVNNDLNLYISQQNNQIDNIKQERDVEIEQNQLLAQDIQLKNEQLIDEIYSLQKQILNTDVGTFKYISRQIGLPLDTTVNLFIIMIVIVFDPLAISLILAYNSLLQKRKVKQKEHKHVNIQIGEPTVTKRGASQIGAVTNIKGDPTINKVATQKENKDPSPVVKLNN